jgi:hypothetical protein
MRRSEEVLDLVIGGLGLFFWHGSLLAVDLLDL